MIKSIKLVVMSFTVTFAKKLKRLTEHSSHKNFGSSKRLFQEN